jgi:hypothetical protein
MDATIHLQMQRRWPGGRWAKAHRPFCVRGGLAAGRYRGSSPVPSAIARTDRPPARSSRRGDGRASRPAFLMAGRKLGDTAATVLSDAAGRRRASPLSLEG